MNFAAQLFYSSYLSERLERLYSPRLALKDSEENDPFWQRWEITTCSPLDPPDFSPNQLSSLTQLRPVETDLPSTQSLEISNSVPLSSVPPPHPLISQPTLTNTPSNLPSLFLPTPPDLNHKGKSTQTTTCLPNPCLAAAIPKSRTYELPSNKPPAPSRSSVETASSSTIFQSSSLTPAPYRGEQHLTFQALVDLLLRLVLYLILLFVPREELRLGPSQPNSSYKCGPLNNGTAGRRPTLIEPERLKDFGEEDLVNGEEQQRKGVIVANDCNFSMAVAHHSVELKIPVFVIMPSCCSLPRLRIYRDYGAMVISYGSTNHDSQNHACHLAKENGYLYLEEEESAVYLAGLGTVGMEIFEQVPKLDAVVVPAAGQYGLLAGTAAAIKHLNPQVLVIGIEPEGFPLLLQSLKTDSPVKDIHSNPNKKLYGAEEDSLVAMLRFQEFERSTVDTEGAMGLAAILAGQLTGTERQKGCCSGEQR
ncbi:Phenylserine dehydratase [Larimichthys crocea]|uniref:Uncharacterized protein n=1 Tax=Larimichthys crocea TaxID=215358 RepID=A0ACD3QBH2_LARCR|nr:Phenylserine dehydratase [Larimichthys crocea]